VPRFCKDKKAILKFWWDEEKSILKRDSMRTHEVWVKVGKQSSGILFKERNEAKYKYKLKIKMNNKSKEQLKTSSLQNELKSKNKVQLGKL